MKLVMLVRMFAFGIWSICTTLVGCKSDGPAGPQGPPGPTLSGELSGFGYLVDPNGRPLTDHSGILVQLEGTQIQTTTTANGKWLLGNIPAGTYTLSLSKTGYGTQKAIGYAFVGGGRMFTGTWYLDQIATYYVATLTSSLANGVVTVRGRFVGTLPQSIYNLYGMLFIGSTSSVSSDPATYVGALTAYGGYADTTLSVQIDSSNFHNWGFQPGTTAYLAAYGGYPYRSSYPDTATGRTYYTALNPTRSNVISVTVP